MTDGNDSARGRVYAPLEGLLNSGGKELLLYPPAPLILRLERLSLFWTRAVEQYMHHRVFPERKIILAKSPNLNNKVRGGKKGERFRSSASSYKLKAQAVHKLFHVP